VPPYPGRYRPGTGARQGRPGSPAARVTYLLEPKNWLTITVGYLLVGLLGWSRVALRDHTTAQVIGGDRARSAAAVLAYAVM
jgi:hypothetical protein